jgi:glutamate racemase
MPYGQRSLQEVQRFSLAIVEALLAQGCKLIVIACNTASAAALAAVRRTGRLPVRGHGTRREARRGAHQHRHRGRHRHHRHLPERALRQHRRGALSQGVTVLHQPCPGLVRQIESGEFDHPATEAMLRGWLEPMLAQHIDALVLGCTHYPIVRPVIERIVGPDVYA